MPTNSFLQLNLSLKCVHNTQIPWIINLWYPDSATFSNPITLFLIPSAEAIVHSQENWSVAGIACFRRNYPEGHRGCSLWKQNYLWLSMSAESAATDQRWPLQNGPAEPHLTLTDPVCHRTCLLVWPRARSSVPSRPVVQFIPTQRALFAFHRQHGQKTRTCCGRSMKKKPGRNRF